MKLLKHFVSFVVSLAALAAAVLALAVILDEHKRASYVRIEPDESV